MRDLEGDKMHVLVLFFLYILQVDPKNILDKNILDSSPTFFLQGIPLGLIHSVPLVLGKKEVKNDQDTSYGCRTICTICPICAICTF